MVESGAVHGCNQHFRQRLVYTSGKLCLREGKYWGCGSVVEHFNTHTVPTFISALRRKKKDRGIEFLNTVLQFVGDLKDLHCLCRAGIEIRSALGSQGPLSLPCLAWNTLCQTGLELKEITCLPNAWINSVSGWQPLLFYRTLQIAGCLNYFVPTFWDFWDKVSHWTQSFWLGWLANKVQSSSCLSS